MLIRSTDNTISTHKVVLLWRNSSKLEGVWAGNALEFPERKSDKESSYMDNYNRYLNL